MKRSISIMMLIAIIFTFTGCSKTNDITETSEIFAMSTSISQKVVGQNAKKAITDVEARIKEIENILSMYIETSDISKINSNSGIAPVKVDSYTIGALKTAKKYSHDSKGIFDITVAPLTMLWGITSDNPKVPSETEINSILPLINYNDLEIDETNSTVFLKQKGMAIDLGGVAKGYFCSEAKKIYEKYNVQSALLSIGGNIYVYGEKQDQSMYTLGIRDPNSQNAVDIFGKLKIKDQIIATSGAYERYFEQDGKIYHHILDTKTGYPAESDLLSVSVISNDGGLSDFLSTTLFIAGSKNIDKYLNNNDFMVIVVDKKNNIYISDKLKAYFELTNENYKIV